MKLRILSDKNIADLKNTTRGSFDAARKIWPHVKVDYLTSRHIGFTSNDPMYHTNHSVIYFSEKKFDDSWRCDCMWFTLQGKYCKHILSVFLRIKNDPDFLKRLRDSIVYL